MMISVSLKDEITPMITRFLQNNPRFISSLTKSVGWFVQSNTKKLSQQKRITSKWKKRVPLDIRRKLDDQAPEKWLGQLRQAIGYQYVNGSALVGWTSATAAMEGRIQEFGTTRQVTPRLRQFFSSRGVPLSDRKERIRVPARPLFDPAMDIIQPKLTDFMEQRVYKYIENGGFTKNVGKGRKYEVFG